MEISQAILDDLTWQGTGTWHEQAKASERLRMNLDLRDSVTDDSQRTWQGTGTWQYPAYTQTPGDFGNNGVPERETQSGVLRSLGDMYGIVCNRAWRGECGCAWQGTGTWHERASLLPVHGRGQVRGSNRQTPRGKHRVEYYDELGICTESFVIEPGGEKHGRGRAWQGTGTWHERSNVSEKIMAGVGYVA